MSEICYIEKNFRADALQMIAKARRICEEYAEQGYDLTLRQLYYQFVSRDWIANRDSEYKRLGSIINDARLAGRLDWDYIVDRTRNLRSLAHWDSPADLVKSAAQQFRVDKWAHQPVRTEVWIEKDALVGVLESCCPGEDVPFFSCRGYTSQSEIWGAAQRLGGYLANGQDVVVIHLGDHDPSGIDMTRDIHDRVSTFIAHDHVRDMIEMGELDQENEDDVQGSAWEIVQRVTVDRIALNMNQIEQYDPPPNPAKLTDARARGYIAEHGPSSWELDALEPTVLVGLIRDAIHGYRDDEVWDAQRKHEESERLVLTAASKRWDDVRALLNGGKA